MNSCSMAIYDVPADLSTYYSFKVNRYNIPLQNLKGYCANKKLPYLVNIHGLKTCLPVNTCYYVF